MLEHLELNYFKKHEHLVVDFAAGLNGIVGPNYKGKSTVLYGILYCLGGARMVPGKRLQTRGTNAGFRQVLRFQVPGLGRYRIERTKTGANLFELIGAEEQLVASGARPVNQAVARLLGMPLKRFAQIKYARQRKAASLLEYGSGELFKIITELTGLDRVGAVLDGIGSDLKTWRQVVENTPVTDLDAQQTQLQAWLEEEAMVRGDVGCIEHDIKQLEAERESTAATERRLSEAQTAVFAASTTLRHAEHEAERAKAALAEAEQKVAEFRGAPRSEEELSLLDAELKTLREQLQTSRQAQTRLAVVREEAEQEALRYQTAANQVVALRATYHAAQQATTGAADLADLREQQANAKARVTTTREQLDQLVEAGRSGVCNACQRPFEAFNPEQHAAHVEAMQGSLRLHLVAVEGLRGSLEAAEQAATQLAEAERALQRAESTTNGLLQSRNRLQAQLAEAQQAVNDLPNGDSFTARIEQLEAQITTGRQDAQRQATLQRALDEAQGATRQRLRDQAYAETALQRICQEHQVEGLNLGAAMQEVRDQALRQDSSLRRCRERLESLRGQTQVLAEQRVALEHSLLVAMERNQQADAAAHRVGLLGELQGHIRDNRDRYSKQVWDVFMASASLFASNATGGVIESITRGEDGAFTFIEDGFEMEQDEASGAQLAIIGTAVQMALADAAQSPLDVILMDEPTADMDPERALAFSTLLASSGKQVLMVTHRELDATVFDNTVEL